MGSLNRATVIGYLGRDAELKYVADGTAVATVSLATTETWNDKSGQKKERTTWHRCVLWGKQAESLAEYLTKGRQVYMDGRIQTNEWTDKDGNKRSTNEIRVERVVLLGKGKDWAEGGAKSGQEHQASEFAGSEANDDDIPF